jgi:hypothetical protein
VVRHQRIAARVAEGHMAYAGVEEVALELHAAFLPQRA